MSKNDKLRRPKTAKEHIVLLVRIMLTVLIAFLGFTYLFTGLIPTVNAGILEASKLPMDTPLNLFTVLIIILPAMILDVALTVGVILVLRGINKLLGEVANTILNKKDGAKGVVINED